MAQFKVLILVIVVIISIRNHKNQNCNYQNDQVLFYSQSDTVLLKKNEYLITQTSDGFRVDLTILVESKVEQLKTLENPHAIFYIKGEKIIAVGWFEFSATLPSGSGYMFPLTNEKKVRIFNNKRLFFTHY